MSYIPFFLDQSLLASLIKSISKKTRDMNKLKQLREMMMSDITHMPYRYLEQAQRRAEVSLALATDESEREHLSAIHAMAFRRIQRIHMENRP
jgi:hypothetical protein